MAIGTLTNPDVREEIVRAHPDQNVSTLYRWGPRWEDGARGGIWVVNTIYHVALRMEWDADLPVEDFKDFTRRLEAARELPDRRIADEKMRAFSKAEALSAKLSRSQRRRHALDRVRQAVAAGSIGGPDDGDEAEKVTVPA